jgi:aspartate carbamoyltransferase catalytic subunit
MSLHENLSYDARVTVKSIFSIDDLSDGDVSRLFYRARSFKTVKPVSCFKEAVLLTAFFEPSTRTRLSFEMAAHRLSMRVSTFHADSSSLAKGETNDLTIMNLLAMAPDILVIRQQQKLMSMPNESTSIINAGDGINEHPSQALLDCFTLIEHFQDDNLFNKRILIVGDVAHSRVAHSNIKLMSRLGAKICLLAPSLFQQDSWSWQASSWDQIEDNFDAVICLRVQKERLGHQVFDQQAFVDEFSLTAKRFTKLGASCVIMHPQPINFGVEMVLDLFKHPQALIMEQVKNGVLIRAALLEHCLQHLA